MSKHDIFEAAEILKRINDNEQLSSLELDGFIRGIRAGKTMDVNLDVLKNSLMKQVGDWNSAFVDYILGTATLGDLQRCIADIRNVAGVIFLKLCEKRNKAAIEGLGKLFEES